VEQSGKSRKVPERDAPSTTSLHPDRTSPSMEGACENEKKSRSDNNNTESSAATVEEMSHLKEVMFVLTIWTSQLYTRKSAISALPGNR
jgi:hypothetical protein